MSTSHSKPGAKPGGATAAGAVSPKPTGPGVSKTASDATAPAPSKVAAAVSTFSPTAGAAAASARPAGTVKSIAVARPASVSTSKPAVSVPAAADVPVVIVSPVVRQLSQDVATPAAAESPSTRAGELWNELQKMRSLADSYKAALDACQRALDRERLTSQSRGVSEPAAPEPEPESEPVPEPPLQEDTHVDSNGTAVDAVEVQIEVAAPEPEPEHSSEPAANVQPTSVAAEPEPAAAATEAPSAEAAAEVARASAADEELAALRARVAQLESAAAVHSSDLNTARGTISDIATMLAALRVDVTAARALAATTTTPAPAATTVPVHDLAELRALVAQARVMALELPTGTTASPVTLPAVELSSIREDVARARALALALPVSTGGAVVGSSDASELAAMVAQARTMAVGVYAALDAVPSILADVAAARAIAATM